MIRWWWEWGAKVRRDGGDVSMAWEEGSGSSR